MILTICACGCHFNELHVRVELSGEVLPLVPEIRKRLDQGMIVSSRAHWTISNSSSNPDFLPSSTPAINDENECYSSLPTALLASEPLDATSNPPAPSPVNVLCTSTQPKLLPTESIEYTMGLAGAHAGSCGRTIRRPYHCTTQAT